MRKYKITALFLTVAIMLLCFCGCRKNNVSDLSCESSFPSVTVSEESEEQPTEESAPESTTVSASVQKNTSSASSVSSSQNTPAKPKTNPSPYLLKVNRTQNLVIAYSKDQNGEYTVPAKAMVCSVGLSGATPTGTYNTLNKYVWRELMGKVYGQYATRITGSILFHSVQYSSQNKSTLKCNEYNKLGSSASHGCVRMTVADAKWIYDNCPIGTTVVIYDSNAPEPLAKPSAQKIDPTSPICGWDPTDPDPNNPYNNTAPVTPTPEPSESQQETIEEPEQTEESIQQEEQQSE